MKKHTIFVTGTDTEVGKTVVTGLIARYIQARGNTVITQKWVQTGCRGFSPDIATHLQVMNRKKSDIIKYQQDICPYSFPYPASPHLAARKAKTIIRKQKIISSFKRLSRDFNYVIVEGIGGALVPYTKKSLVIDIARQLQIPAVVVAGNGLGAVNHTLLTIEALKARGIPLLGVIFNECRPAQPRDILTDNPRAISAVSKVPVLGILPYNQNYDSLYTRFQPIGRNLSRRLEG